MLDPRAIATLGIGYGADLLARIGLWPSVVTPDYLPGGGVFQPRRLKDPRKKREDEELLLFFN